MIIVINVKYAQGGDRFAFLKLKQYEKSIYGNRVPLMKKAEIYYTLAECLNELGNESERRRESVI